MVRCPKCAHEQRNTFECESCGLIFRRYEEIQDRKKEAAQRQELAGARKGGNLAKAGSAMILAALCGAAAWFFLLHPKEQSPAPLSPPQASFQQQPAPHAPPQPAQQAAPRIAAAGPGTGAAIEQAKNATVAIETPWGKGSGFFIDDTSIVTNKHVVEPDRSQLDDIRHRVTTSREMINLEQQSINEIRNKINQMPDSPTRRQLIIILREKEQQLARVLPEVEQAEARLKEMEKPVQTSDIKIILADGSEYQAQSKQVSSSRDLALLSLYAAKAPILRPAPENADLKQGDKVFTIGNPVGLRNTVTAGIFSGFREHRETREVLLQIDAPINPGNSGGPLIDERGRVLGVNTMIIQNTQGIGFAIPIREVFKEFSLTPPRE